MKTLRELEAYLDQLLPLNGTTDYCPNGLQVEGKSTISTVATAVSASLETIEAAIEQGVDVLIVHHGLFWQRDSYVIRGTKKEKTRTLAKESNLIVRIPFAIGPAS